ncbi:MAG: hypothetical protein KIT16_17920 [Rhodospirillaceae bacterium]|nr:hypothetical protein [Rhodospirillaceae bacterium]
MHRFPRQFADFLTARGRRLLEGRDAAHAGALAQKPFVAIRGALDPAKARAARALLDEALLDRLQPLERGIPPESIANQTRNHQERLIKTVRVATAYLERRRSAAWQAAERIGLIAMTGSDTWHRFAEVLAGQALDRRSGRQVLCYRQGDYAGPHTDHHPEDPRAAGGYVDLHLTFASPAVAQQWLVYAEDGHFRHVCDVAVGGGITAYRLPFWHYTTPLVAKPGRGAAARRWVVLGTFRYARRHGAGARAGG